MPVEAVGKAVVDAVEKDLPDVIVMRGAPRALTVASIAMPRVFERIALKADLAAPGARPSAEVIPIDSQASP